MTEARIPCINPRCRRTAAAEKFPGHDCIICRACFRALPASISRRFKSMRARERKVARLFSRERRKAGYPQEIAPAVPTYSARMYVVQQQLDRLADANYRAIAEFYLAPEKPEGLDAFLEEVGF